VRSKFESLNGERLLNGKGHNMKKRGRLTVAILFIVMIAIPALAQDDIGVGGIETKLRLKDTHGNVSYSIEATIRNSGGTPKDVTLILQAIAGSGIEVKTVKLRGRIDPHSARALKGINKMRSQDYEAIDKWEVKEILVHQ
jgi:hypothetical protein